MNKSSIYHRTIDNYCYALDSDNLIITIKTGFDICSVSLFFSDPFSGGLMGSNESQHFYEKIMDYKVELDDCIMWSATVTPEFKRCAYYFSLSDGTEKLLYLEDGFHEDLNASKHERLQFFIFPWMNPADINIVPDWVQDTVWYQIFPDRFCNGNPDINPSFTKKWKEPDKAVNFMDFYGGDIRGIINKLEYLNDLGITGLYLTPVCKSNSNHKYDITDYLTISPDFGTEDDMCELVDKAHQLGMRVMMDGVFNHSSVLFPPWRDVVKKGPESKYYNWFMVNKWPFAKSGTCNAQKGNYYSFAFVDAMPKLNTNNPEVIKYFVHVCIKWIKTFDIDGIRFDVIDETSHKFCRALRKNLKKIKPDIFLLGESWHDSMAWLTGTELDSVMNYPLKDSIINFWLNKDSAYKAFEHAVNRCYSMYMQQTNKVLFNLLDSHDTERLITTLGNLNMFFQQMAVLFTMPGTACIYYGTEVALEGGHDPDCRRCMPWSHIENGEYTSITANIKSLISLRKKYDALKSTAYSFTHPYDNQRVVSYDRYDVSTDKTFDKNACRFSTTISVVLNCSDEAVSINTLDHEILFSNLFDNGTLNPDGTLIYLKHNKDN